MGNNIVCAFRGCPYQTSDFRAKMCNECYRVPLNRRQRPVAGSIWVCNRHANRCIICLGVVGITETHFY